MYNVSVLKNCESQQRLVNVILTLLNWHSEISIWKIIAIENNIRDLNYARQIMLLSLGMNKQLKSSAINHYNINIVCI